MGSPPHTRGKVAMQFIQFIFDRITPAHAGKRLARHLSTIVEKDHPRTRGEKRPVSGLRPVSGDHPRTRGEKVVLVNMHLMEIGSPPHTRGKVAYLRQRYKPVRITPAHAGKRGSQPIPSQPGEDHPRTRGEKNIRRRCHCQP